MKKISAIVDDLQYRLFESVVANNLVYNTCWEDPRLDRQLLQLSSNSKVVMLTSAGCNALDYLLDDPQVIYCVDSNSAQNALLEFKKILFKRGNYQLLWDFFGEGKKQAAELIYHQQLRNLLSAEVQTYWDEHISYFTPTFSQPSFYFSGTSGKIALMIYRRIHRKGLYSKLLQLLNANNLQEQTYFFEVIEPQLWNAFHKWLIRQHATMTMLGVPSTQRAMIEQEYRGGLLPFIRDALRHVFTRIPLADNYFWRVYITGSYTPACCPNYLLKQNFEKLTKRIEKISTHTSSLLTFLKGHPNTYSHFVLLDHQDWIADNQPRLLAKEWRQILLNSEKGTRILFRSAGVTRNFLPAFVFNHVDFQSELTAEVHQEDRAGTYGSTHLGVVK